MELVESRYRPFSQNSLAMRMDGMILNETQSERLPLCTLPTALHRLEKISRSLNSEIWIKRDDLTGFAMGGSKARRAEFLFADALRNECDVILTEGPIQSNHARVIAPGARRFSKHCHLFLSGRKPDQSTANLLLDELADAQIHFVQYEERSATMEAFAAQLREKGRRPYVIPVGGANDIGVQGDVQLFQELGRQLQALPPMRTVLVFASSSGGTHAGLLVGKELTGSQVDVLGIRVSRDPNPQQMISAKATGFAKHLGLPKKFQLTDVVEDENYVGEDYGIPSKEGENALKRLWQSEGILLEPVYTAKAMAGLMDLARSGEWTDRRVVFLHTGGTPSIFDLPS
jgi:D-cysteine desulfhydrase